MDTISREFDIKLKKVNHAPKSRVDLRFAALPGIIRYLLLASQIERLMKNDPDLSLTKVASWLGWSYTRIKQIVNLLNLCPKIQEELLLADAVKIRHITESALRPIALEIFWQKQISLWENLYQPPQNPALFSLPVAPESTKQARS